MSAIWVPRAARAHAGPGPGSSPAPWTSPPGQARALIDDHARLVGVTLRVLARSITDGSVHPTELLTAEAQRPDAP
ncbi:hypothetical protein ACNJ7E_26650 [Rhodococcus sp. NM-2]|uniref:hypothetical protein n=1 Tax=Rhodococcus sp. NM-2 TaxID=3401174 RepID=UPI003AAB9AC8